MKRLSRYLPALTLIPSSLILIIMISYFIVSKPSNTIETVPVQAVNVTPQIATESSQPAYPVISQQVVMTESKTLGESTPSKNIYLGHGTGFDFSYPQCLLGYPNIINTFAIIGVTGGKAFKNNPCLLSEYNWAKSAQIPTTFYMNLNFPSGTTVDKGLTGPAGNCLDQDVPCQAYNYGWNAAQDAKNNADSLWISSTTWWLDIEVYNTWLASTSLNEKVITGAIDYFRNRGLTVGVYSSPKQWYQIVSPSYSPKVPVWISGAADKSQVDGFCNVSVGGGPVWLSQYSDLTYDYNIACR